MAWKFGPCEIRWRVTNVWSHPAAAAAAAMLEEAPVYVCESVKNQDSEISQQCYTRTKYCNIIQILQLHKTGLTQKIFTH